MNYLEMYYNLVIVLPKNFKVKLPKFSEFFLITIADIIAFFSFIHLVLFFWQPFSQVPIFPQTPSFKAVSSENPFVSQESRRDERKEPEVVANKLLVKIKSLAIYRLKARASGAKDTGTLSLDELNKKHGAVKFERLVRKRQKEGLPSTLAPVPSQAEEEREIDKWVEVEFSGLPNKIISKNSGEYSALQAILEDYERSPDVELVEPDYIWKTLLIPNDPNFSKLWGMHNAGQTGGTADADIDAPEIWDITTSSNINVGVIDTGIDHNHEDLAANTWTNPGEIAGNGLDDDGNGYIDDIRGWDWVNNDNDPMDDHGHGTHVAGTIAAIGNNGVGVAGVNWTGKVAALKFLSSGGSGTTANAIKAVEYATLKGFKITNNSWGGGGFSQALLDAINAANTAGHLFMAAAGNNGANTDISPHYPSSYNLPNIIAVAATDHKDLLATFSNFGVVSVDLGAPGVNIFSTVPKGACSLCNPSGYRSLNGTSMATPHVAGAAALFWSSNPLLGHLAVKDKLMSFGDAIAVLSSKTVSGKRLNLYNPFDNDTTPPAAVNDLNVANTGLSKVTLNWTATGDDGSIGQANQYDVRYSQSPINEANFNSATQIAGEPKPAAAGSSESFVVEGLLANTTYYFALKVFDNVNNSSPLSNVVSAITQGTIVFSDDMESGPGGWTIQGSDGVGGPALWHQSQRRSSSPVISWYYGKESTGNFNTGARNFGSITSAPINLSGIAESTLIFSHFLDTENNPNFDKAKVQIISPSGTVTLLNKMSTSGLFAKETLDLSSYNGQTIQVRFDFDTIDAILNNFEGWYVDDVAIVGLSTQVQRTLTVNKTGMGTGTVTSNPAGIDCGATCSAKFTNASTTVSLTATPDSSSAFTSWSGDCSGTGSCVVTMSADRNVTANFNRTDLKVYWKFDEGSGTTAIDSSESGNSGKLTNEPVYSASTPPIVFTNPKSLSFDGSNDFVVNADSTLNNSFSGDVTVSLWFRADKAKAGRFVDLAQASSPGLQMAMDKKGKVLLVKADGVSSEIKTNTSKADDQWHHLATVRSGKNYSFYVDGVLIDTKAGKLVTYNRLFVAARSNKDNKKGSNLFTGFIDDVRVYSRALSDAEIKDLAAGK